MLQAFQTDPNAEIRARLEECREKLAATAQWHKDAFGGIFRKAPEQQARERNLATLPQVWLDFQIGNATKNSTCHTYRVTIALYSDTVPRTAENFRCLCTGERGLGAHGAPLHFRRSLVYKAHSGVVWDIEMPFWFWYSHENDFQNQELITSTIELGMKLAYGNFSSWSLSLLVRL